MKTKRSFTHHMNHWFVIGLVMMTGMMISCQSESRGFVLPEGDVARGKQAFTDLACTRCHSIADVAWTGSHDFDDAHIELGGDVTTMKTYGELVTSVINPSHKISQQHVTDEVLTRTDGSSKMEEYRFNEIMTVQELVDIVTFLQSEYNLVAPDNPYPYPGF